MGNQKLCLNVKTHRRGCWFGSMNRKSLAFVATAISTRFRVPLPQTQCQFYCSPPSHPSSNKLFVGGLSLSLSLSLSLYIYIYIFFYFAPSWFLLTPRFFQGCHGQWTRSRSKTLSLPSETSLKVKCALIFF